VRGPICPSPSARSPAGAPEPWDGRTAEATP
jgi:hypothetical protein